jgi:predicted AAA+ superfamily ATPase
METVLLRAAQQFPVVLLTGARQTGKSTLLQHVFADYAYVTLDYPDVRALAKRDPELFLERYSAPMILDEIQQAPELLPYIKVLADKRRSVKGRYILTGSQYFPLMAGVSESLAGRVSVHNLYGFSSHEACSGSDVLSADDLFGLIYRGFYPEPVAHGVDSAAFYSAYLQTYLERDIRQLLAVHDLALFQSFIELLAARVGGLLNLSEIAKECGTSFTTLKRWLSLLEATEIVYLLRPFHRNITKRVVRSPKIFFTDTGLLAHILRYQSAQTLLAGPMAGHIFENFVLMELLKHRSNHGTNFEVYFYRDSNGQEVDLVIEADGRFCLGEVKLAKSIRHEHGSALERVLPLFPSSKGYVLSMDNKGIPLSRNIESCHWSQAVAQMGCVRS